MKKLASSLLLLILALTVSWGQEKNQQTKKEIIESFRVEFYTEALQLTPAESEAFWPLLNQFETGKEALKNSFNKNAKVELMSDEEVEAHLTSHFEFEEKELALKKDYFQKLKPVLPVRKIAMLPKVEREFKRMLVAKMREQRESMRGQREKLKEQRERTRRERQNTPKEGEGNSPH